MFTMMVIMALATTAMTGPLFHLVWLRHQKEPVQYTQGNYLTDALAEPENSHSKNYESNLPVHMATFKPASVAVVEV